MNRLNKTKVEKFPDLAMEKEEKLKLIRKKGQAAKLERVSFSRWKQDRWTKYWSEKRRGKGCARTGREEVAERSCL